MKIGINGRFWHKPFTGIGQYTRNIFVELAKQTPKNEYIIVVEQEVAEDMEVPRNVKFHLIPEPNVGSAGLKKAWWEYVYLPKFFRKNGFDTVIFPYPANPYRKQNYNMITVVHDCIPWKNKKYAERLTAKLYHSMTRKALKAADQVLTVSEYSKNEIEKYCGVAAKKVDVIYNGCSLAATNPTPSPIKTNEPYFLYVGGFDDRKNVDYLLREFEKFRKNHKDLKLVLAGGKLFKNKLYQSFDTEVEGVEKTGFLSTEELTILYRNCLAFVNFSKDEGFNLPVLEAAASGKALLISDIPVHRELWSREAAVFVDINEKGEGKDAMERILNQEIREKLELSALKESKKYSWKNSASKLKNAIFSL